MPEELNLRPSHESDLKSLHDIFFELSGCQSEREVCMNAVRLGHARLRFDRLSIWLVDAKDPRWKLGTWGIDEEGRLRDESGARLPRAVADLPPPLVVEPEAELRDHEGAVVGRGSRIIAPLWDGHRLLGELYADDLLGHEGFGEERQESFLILARLAAQLVSLKRAEAELRLLASTDSLTGTVNRRTALLILEKHIGQSLRSGAPLSLCLADLDGLKIVNDAYGHAAGDEYICRASAALVEGVRGSDTVSRIGGDEFLIIFPDCRRDIVASILDGVNEELAAGSVAEAYMPRLSWGTAFLDEVARGSGTESCDLRRCVDMLLELADQRMYDNKRSRAALRGGSAAEQSSGRSGAGPGSPAGRPRAGAGARTAP
jgi:diguanylate cyclase (GGDEF)-like protein